MHVPRYTRIRLRGWSAGYGQGLAQDRVAGYLEIHSRMNQENQRHAYPLVSLSLSVFNHVQESFPSCGYYFYASSKHSLKSSIQKNQTLCMDYFIFSFILSLPSTVWPSLLSIWTAPTYFLSCTFSTSFSLLIKNNRIKKYNCFPNWDKSHFQWKQTHNQSK